MSRKFLKNNNLHTIKKDWRGNPLDEKNRFVNKEFPYLPNALRILKWQFGGNPQKSEKQNDTQRIEIKNPNGFLQNETDGILWLGHAGFFIRLDGINILIDPVFGTPPFVKTFVDVPPPLYKIKKADYILISHDHRDHADKKTIKQLTGKFPEAQIFSGLRMEGLLNKWKKSSNKLQTAGWYQQFFLTDERLKIFFLPTRHWSRRGFFDTNKRLWGAFVIQGAGKTIYFGGDSGCGNHYKILPEIFPQIDYALIGIGAYKPRWIMRENHNSPAEAWQGFVESKAKFMIPMHYGRFDLSDEPPNEPLKFLFEASASENSTDKIIVLQINENLDLSN